MVGFLLMTFNAQPPHGAAAATTENAPKGLEETLERTSHNGDVTLNKLSLDGNKYGHSVWISRKKERCKIKYFAQKTNSQSVYDRYVEFKKDKTIVMVCSGAFSTGDAVPIGLTVDNGVIANRNIDDKMDGLVVVYATGGIAVCDLDKGSLSLQSLSGSLDPRKDKAKLLDWAVQKGATIFQTQLLAYDNTLRVTSQARTERAERRFLVLAKSKSGELFHIVFYVTAKDAYLFDTAKQILDYLVNTKGVQVAAMLNVDTGHFNIMDLFDSYGNLDSQCHGDVDIKTAANLVIYYK